jgi:hypothetical protein
MDFGSDTSMTLIGERVGFFLAYLIFTAALFALLLLVNRFPESWNLLHISMITLAITAVGRLIRWALE